MKTKIVNNILRVHIKDWTLTEIGQIFSEWLRNPGKGGFSKLKSKTFPEEARAHLI